MIEELQKYRQKGNFLFRPSSKLAEVCNAPANSSGVFAIYALERGRVNLVFVGISGKEGPEATIIHNKGGMKAKIVTGKQFGGFCRNTWPMRMKLENIDALEIHWFVTYGGMEKDFPRNLEIDILTKHQEQFGRLPRWNTEI
ncbi:MAG: hypothetical protein CFE21_08310 [Bacteroidetes bacterium B1(2017)]|nr:MAG: hypothetical protein CFE21_08310 [Bacteroidetes bacterium B1(2017)]